MHELTTFKPFTMRELEVQVWDACTAHNGKFMSKFEDLGLICCKDHDHETLQTEETLLTKIEVPPTGDADQTKRVRFV